MIDGDFNFILDASEILGGLPVTNNEIVNFAQCVNNCVLTELKFSGSKFTWWNGRIEEKCIFKRLDRVFGNIEFMHQFPTSEIQHLIREGSDHCPLLVSCNSNQERFSKPFRFLNFWVKNENFLKVVKKDWEANMHGDPFYNVHMKMKRLKKTLMKWSKETYGNIFLKVDTFEDVVKVKEMQFEINSTELNKSELMKAKTEIYNFYQLEEEF